MASAGERSRGQNSFRLVQDSSLKDWDYQSDLSPPQYSSRRVMSRAPGFAESSYFIHQRYEDTALVIFQQNLKKKKETNPGQYKQREQAPFPAVVAQHPLYTIPSPVIHRAHLNSSPSRGGDGGYSSPGNISPGSGASPQHSPGSAYATPSPGPSPVRAVSPGFPRGAAAKFSNNHSPDGEEFASAESGGSHLDSPVAQSEFYPLPPVVGQVTLGHSVWTQQQLSHRAGPAGVRPGEEDRHRAGVDVQDQERHRRRVRQDGSVTHEDRSAASGDGVSLPQAGSDVGRYGSFGIVVRRPVAMTKSDTARTQSTICTVM